MKIIVTGATGFVGRQLIPLLVTKGWEVHAISSKPQTEQLPNIFWHQCNLLNSVDASAAIKSIGATHLIHLAWYAEPGKFWGSEENFLWVNATLNIISAFYAGGGRRIVVAGTCAEYDWRFGYCREEITPLAPSTPYGKCKNATRELLMTFGEVTGVEVVWARIFYMYGPFEAPKRLTSSVAASLLAGSEALCTHGNQIRDFLHVADVATAFEALMASQATGAFNIGSSEPTTIKSLVRTLAQELGRNDLLKLNALQAPAEDPPLILADTQKIRALGWRPNYSIQTGIADTVNWWKKSFNPEMQS